MALCRPAGVIIIRIWSLYVKTTCCLSFEDLFNILCLEGWRFSEAVVAVELAAEYAGGVAAVLVRGGVAQPVPVGRQQPTVAREGNLNKYRDIREDGTRYLSCGSSILMYSLEYKIPLPYRNKKDTAYIEDGTPLPYLSKMIHPHYLHCRC